jgi:hypothetical protein
MSNAKPKNIPEPIEIGDPKNIGCLEGITFYDNPSK